MVDQFAWNKPSLLLKNILQNTQSLQVFAMNIKTESIYKKVIRNASLIERLRCLLKKEGGGGARAPIVRFAELLDKK
jgi:hypothetical protein